MPSVSDLGQKVKAKYPGTYDDLPDDEVGRRVKSRYPGSYDDFVDTAPQQPSQPERKPNVLSSLLSGAGKGLAKTIVNAGQLGQKLEKTTGLQALYRKTGMPEAAISVKPNMDEFKTENTAEKIGYGVEQVAELLAPVSKAGTAANATSKLAKVGQLAKKGLTEGAEFAGKTAVQTGGDAKSSAKAFLAGVAMPFIGAGVKAVAKPIVKYATEAVPERIMSRIFKTAEEDLRSAYQTAAKGKDIDPTLAREVLERGLKGNSKNMAVYSFRKLDDLESQVQALAKNNQTPIVLDPGAGKKQYSTLLLTIKNQFDRSFFTDRAKAADQLLKEIRKSPGEAIPMDTTLKLRRFLDNMRNTTSFRTDTALAPKQEEFKVAANILRKKLADAGLGDLMKEERIFIEAIDAIVDDAAKRQNKNIIGLVDILAGGGGMISGGPLSGITAAAALRGVQQPLTLTNAAQGLYKAGKAVPKVNEKVIKPISKVIKASAVRGTQTE